MSTVLPYKKFKSKLIFSDGSEFKGFTNVKINSPLFGEAALTTGMAGYQETMTDPSFLGQHILFTHSHIGNYPADNRANQSNKVHASCVIARNFSQNEYFDKLDVPMFSCPDTRSIVKYLTQGNNNNHSSYLCDESVNFKDLNFDNSLSCNDLDKVSTPKVIETKKGDQPIVVIDYGCKNAIYESLQNLGFPLVKVPYNTSFKEIKDLDPRMVFLSNGPGDPRAYTEQISVVKEILEKSDLPVRGICLGHQLLGLAQNIPVIKLPFGQRGVNHPVQCLLNNKIEITSQNHGYALEDGNLPENYCITHRSLFDHSIEGIASLDLRVESVQFHPESNPGPSDSHVFFDRIGQYLNKELKNIDQKSLHEFINIKEQQNEIIKSKKQQLPYSKILIIGSGPIKIGQASEFDYSGTQACKSLKEIGLDVVLLNSNPATIMTDPELTYRTFIEPITKDNIKKIIERENVDAVLSTMGGQTALNICIELEKEFYFKNNNIALLGANVRTIELTEDRNLFAIELEKLGFKAGKRFDADSKQEALEVASSQVNFPLIIRRNFALGGKGAVLVKSREELSDILNDDLDYPVTMEKSLLGYKEVELEVMVDKDRDGVIICSIENIDPCGTHTGDSITVAPAQTISDRCLQQLRDISLTIAKHMGVVAGGANVQFAINPNDEDDIVVIEMNPRVSRSSALASKATGYPIAKISALLSIGFTLKEILNDITQNSPVAFEPTLDYVAVKIPIFPFNKFPTSPKKLGPQMKSVGEVLALGGNFLEAFMKGLRSLEMGLEIPSLSQLKMAPLNLDQEYIKQRLTDQQELCLLSCIEALRLGLSVEEVFKLSGITPWFIKQADYFVQKEIQLTAQGSFEESPITAEELLELKSMGFSDKYLAFLKSTTQANILKLRYDNNILPGYKAVDTCSGEFNATTPYFYSTYNVKNEAISLSTSGKPSTVILGSGPNRIGQGIEFDYSCVKSSAQLQNMGIQSIFINSNPETVSTDYDNSDRLYLAPLYSEDIFDILAHEKPDSIISSFSGQTGISLREHLQASFREEIHKFNFLGPSLDILDLTENRSRFDALTRETKLTHAKSLSIQGHKQLLNAITDIGFPVILRPSYVIGGESMYIFNSNEDIEQLPTGHREDLLKSTTRFQIEKYLVDAIEYDVDLVRDQFGNVVFTICEHIEHAGVHSGDSGMVTPPIELNDKNYDLLYSISKELADKMDIIGPINFQFVIKDDQIYCIEANPRGSRTLPFLSKAYGVSLPQIATDALLGKEIPNIKNFKSDYYFVKQSTFPFDRFDLDCKVLGPVMKSTGETMGVDKNINQATLKSYLGNFPELNQVKTILLSISRKDKEKLLPAIKKLSNAGMTFFATQGTQEFLQQNKIECKRAYKVGEHDPDLLDLLSGRLVDLVANTPANMGKSKSDGRVIRNLAAQNGIPCFTRAENILELANSLVSAKETSIQPVSLQDIHE